MSLTFVPAVRHSRKVRIAVTGVSGAGKTFTALSMACALSNRVAVVDTDAGQSALYAGTRGRNFSILSPTKYSPKSLEELIILAEAEGFEVLVIDNFSDYWSGEDGMIDLADKAANGDTRSGWKAVRPEERSLVRRLKSTRLHIIATMRVVTEYAKVTNPKTGKETMQPHGVKPEQRSHIDAEFDVVGNLDVDHRMTVVKTRIEALEGAVIDRPDGSVAVTAAEWLADGAPVTTAADYRDQALLAESADELLTLFREVQRAGMEHVAVSDRDGSPVTLGKMIKFMGLELRRAAESESETAEGEATTEPAPAAEPVSAPVTEPAAAAGDRVQERAVQRAREQRSAQRGQQDPSPVGEIMGHVANRVRPNVAAPSAPSAAARPADEHPAVTEAMQLLEARKYKVLEAKADLVVRQHGAESAVAREVTAILESAKQQAS